MSVIKCAAKRELRFPLSSLLAALADYNVDSEVTRVVVAGLAKAKNLSNMDRDRLWSPVGDTLAALAAARPREWSHVALDHAAALGIEVRPIEVPCVSVVDHLPFAWLVEAISQVLVEKPARLLRENRKELLEAVTQQYAARVIADREQRLADEEAARVQQEAKEKELREFILSL